MAEAYLPALRPDWKDLTEPWWMRTDLVGDWQLHLPGMDPVAVDALRLEVVSRPHGITINARRPPEQQPTTLIYQNDKTGQAKSVPAGDVPFEFDAEMLAGDYYEDVAGRRYYCESRSDSEVRLVLLGSVQHGRRLFAEAIADLNQVRGRYARVTDERAIKELRGLV